MKLIKFSNGDKKHWDEPLFINPEMVVGVEDDTLYLVDRDGKRTVGNEGYTTTIYVSSGWGGVTKPNFRVIGKYEEIAARLMCNI